MTKIKLKILHLGLCVQAPPINGMQKAFIENCSEYRELNCGIANFNEEAIRVSSEFNPDLVFIQIQADNIITPYTVDVLKKNGAYVINWTGDVRDDVPKWMVDLGSDITLFSNMRDVIKCNQNVVKSAFLEIGYDPEIYCPEGPVRACERIVFFGNNYGNQFPMSGYRASMVRFLKSAFLDEFGFYGNGWNDANGNFNNSQRDEAEAYRGSLMAINCSHYEIQRYSSDRIFRILGTGIFCLAKWYPDIEKDFTDGKHLKVWHNLDELKQIINYYAVNVDERQIVAANGNRLAKEKFTFDKMIKNIIIIYNENKTI